MKPEARVFRRAEQDDGYIIYFYDSQGEYVGCRRAESGREIQDLLWRADYKRIGTPKAMRRTRNLYEVWRRPDPVRLEATE